MYSSYFIGVSLKFIQIAFLLISVAPMFNGILHHRKKQITMEDLKILELELVINMA